MTVRQKIVARIAALLATVKVSNGYATNVGDHVFTWRMTDVPEELLPCVSIQDNSESITHDGTGETERNLVVTITALAKDNIATAWSVLDDIERVLGTDRGLTDSGQPLVRHLEVKSAVLNAEHKEFFVASATVTIVVQYFTPEFTPSTLIT